ncbi:MAG: zf-HC2 domain-containing protein [Candidatus Marinimicrobia bacterium]|nr:zf-HC2 domain-containing protein [Candidatus Neomarinimicrobiota bacterium]MBL7030368.1 zf-HC2 domain-containing protein [Candidatus Neomarinimicrobiota bacterium]
MDRYQFEDAISAYLDNELPLSDRKAFEDFMKANSDAKILVDSIRSNMTSVKSLSQIKTSGSFMSSLHKMIEFEKSRPSKKFVNRPSKTLFGFTPLYAGIMTVLIATFITVGINLWPESNSPVNTLPAYTGNITDAPNPAPENPAIDFEQDAVLAASESDSSDTTLQKKKIFKLGDQVKFVKDQR